MQLIFNGKKTNSEINQLIENNRNTLTDIIINNPYGAFIFGDNFKNMMRLLTHYKNKIDLIYIDPPFNTQSTFYFNKEKTSTISNSKNNQIAYKDNMSMDDYLSFMRDRLFLIHQLLSDQGTLCLHIDCKVGHYLKIILDEIFGADNFLNEITRIKSNPKNFQRKAFGNQKDTIYIYAKKTGRNIFNQITEKLTDEEVIKLFPKINEHGERYTTVPCHAPGETKNGATGDKWRDLFPPKGRHWRVSPMELEALDNQGLIEWSKTGNPRIKKFAKNHKGKKIQDVWLNFKDPLYPTYPTEKNAEMLSLLVAQFSNKDSLIMDSFCGSGSFLLAGLKQQRIVLGLDQSDIAKNLIQQHFLLNQLQFFE